MLDRADGRGDHAALDDDRRDRASSRRALDAIEATDARADFPRGASLRARHACAACPNAEIVVVSRRRARRRRATRRARSHLGGRRSSRYVPDRQERQERRASRVLGAPLPARQEPLRGDARGHEHQRRAARTSSSRCSATDSVVDVDAAARSSRASGCRASTRTRRREPHARSHASSSPTAQHDDLPADDHAYALLPERRRARVLVVTPGNTYLEAALLLDEYLDVTTRRAREVPAAAGAVRRHDLRRRRAAASRRAAAALLYLNPRGRGLAGEGRQGEIDDDLGFDTLGTTRTRSLRWTALGDVNIARGAHAQAASRTTRSSARATRARSSSTGARAGRKFVALGFDLRDSDLPLRVAWPLFLLNTINDFVDEDTQLHLELPHRRRVAHPGAAAAETRDADAARRRDAARAGPRGRAVYSASTPASTSSTASAARRRSRRAMFAANLSDPDESAHRAGRRARGRRHEGAARPAGFEVGVRREIWIYLLLARAARDRRSSGSPTTGGSRYERRARATRALWARAGHRAASRCSASLVLGLPALRAAAPATPTLTWARGGIDYELLDPKMLGAGAARAVLPVRARRSRSPICRWPQRMLSVLLRIAFVALLALGLVAPRAHRDDAEGLHGLPGRRLATRCPTRRSRTRAGDRRSGLDARSRRTTSSSSSPSRKRPRAGRRSSDDGEGRRRRSSVDTDADAASRRDELGAGDRHRRPRCSSRTASIPPGYLKRAVILSDGVQTDGDILAEANRAQRLRREGLHRARTAGRCPARSRCATCACPTR